MLVPAGIPRCQVRATGSSTCGVRDLLQSPGRAEELHELSYERMRTTRLCLCHRSFCGRLDRDGGGKHHRAIALFHLLSLIQLNAQGGCNICLEDRTLTLMFWSVGPVCTTMICRTHVHQSPHRTCSNCLLRLQDYLGGASYHNKIKGDVDEMPRNVPALFEAGHRQLSAYARDVEINQVSLQPAQVDYVEAHQLSRFRGNLVCKR